MKSKYYLKLAEKLSISPKQVEATSQLIDEGATVPFIARYRKELTGSLDEVVIKNIRDSLAQYEELDKRKGAITKSLAERELLTPELEAKISSIINMQKLEDFYLPFRPKRKTRATAAKEKGLEPLAKLLLEQNSAAVLAIESAKYVNPELGVNNTDEALAGARDIIAEQVSEDATVREKIRFLFNSEAVISSKLVKGKEEEGEKFKDYFDWQEPISRLAGHRLLAMFRGDKAGVLKISIKPDEEKAVKSITRIYRKNFCASWEEVKVAIEDSYKRLIAPSIETETRKLLKERADEEAIRVFSSNLYELLMAPPLGQKSVLAIDPGIRTGCKVVCLDPQGKLLENCVIYLSKSDQAKEQAKLILKALCQKYNIEAIAIGNGTAGRETETFVRGIGLNSSIPVVMVNESGASIYSASEAAREEFPEYDLTVRGAVSIGRRLMDPLAELVKIDPKSIGVGQYQHDVNQSNLKSALDDVVMSCVNKVGVEVNTASKQLLSYVSGLGKQIAANIVKYREENGAFKNRSELKKVARLGPKAFEQCAGFLRIYGSKNPLDESAVHPESYKIVETMASDIGCKVKNLIEEPELRNKIEIQKYVTEKAGLPTLKDIIKELAKPGRDPRKKFELFSFADGVNKISDLIPGIVVPGIVTNVTKFGAFVDIGVHQDGLVHISQLSDRFVKDPADVVKVNQKVKVRIVEVDEKRKRISLSMKSEQKNKEKW